MQFVKMHGLGNDYVYIDVFHQPEPAEPAKLARQISSRHRGVGSDGLILVGPSHRADARMRMFNADGSESEMCGNGIRCAAKLIRDRQIVTSDRLTIETGRGILTLELEVTHGRVEQVRVDMGPPVLQASRIPTTLPGDPPIEAEIDLEGTRLQLTCVSMGNPHAVSFLSGEDDLDGYPLARLGPLLEHHSAFPTRINFHVVEIRSPSEVWMRTWERGSGLTQACGTGACAVCVAGVLTGRSDRQIVAHLPGGSLTLEWPDADASVFMTGPAVEVFTGSWPDL